MALYGGIELPGKPDLANIQKLDLLPMEAIAEMQRTGMAINKEWFSQLSTQLDGEIKELRREICDYIPPEKLDEFTARANMSENEDSDDPDSDSSLPMNVGSTQQLSKLLFDVLGIGKGRTLKMTKSGSQISTGKKELEKFKREHPVVVKVLSYKERVKLKNTYSDSIPLKSVLHKAGTCWCGEKHWYPSYRIHSQILTTRTATGRLASKNINQQNIPARSELGRRVRAGFIPSKGMEMFAVDFSQFEMRLGAHYSRDENLIDIFKRGLDPHSATAARVFKKTLEEVETEMGKLLYRAPCKNINFSIFYLISPEGLYDLMGLTFATANLDLPEWLTVDWCENLIEDWFDAYPGVREYIDNQIYRAQRYGVTWTLCGRIRRVPEVRSVHPRIVAAGTRQAGNQPVQGTQADLFKIALAECYKEAIQWARNQNVEARVVMAVHDEIVGEVEEGYGEMVVWRMEELMSQVMLDRDTGQDMCYVPILAEGKTMTRWKK